MSEIIHQSAKKFACYIMPPKCSKKEMIKIMDRTVICELNAYEIHMIEKVIYAYMDDVKGFSFNVGPIATLRDVLKKIGNNDGKV